MESLLQQYYLILLKRVMAPLNLATILRKKVNKIYKIPVRSDWTCMRACSFEKEAHQDSGAWSGRANGASRTRGR